MLEGRKIGRQRAGVWAMRVNNERGGNISRIGISRRVQTPKCVRRLREPTLDKGGTGGARGPIDKRNGGGGRVGAVILTNRRARAMAVIWSLNCRQLSARSGDNFVCKLDKRKGA